MRQNQRYCIALLEERNDLMMSETNIPMTDFVSTKTEFDDISPLATETKETNIGICTKKIKDAKKEEYVQAASNCITAVATKLFQDSKVFYANSVSKLPNKHVQGNINNAEREYGIIPSTIKPATVRSRICSNNVGGEHSCQQPLLLLIEPLVVQWSIIMEQIRMFLSWENVIELIINNARKDTDFAKKSLQHGMQLGHVEGKNVVGILWYQRFRNRHKLNL
jgi:hypothetical protein